MKTKYEEKKTRELFFIILKAFLNITQNLENRIWKIYKFNYIKMLHRKKQNTITRLKDKPGKIFATCFALD